jgi:hypothetical protein
LQDLFNVIQKQWELIDDLRRENASLTELLLNCAKVLPGESEAFEQKIEIPQEMQALGREPWYRKKARLEESFRKPKMSTITGIPDDQVEESFAAVSQIAGLEGEK